MNFSQPDELLGYAFNLDSTDKIVPSWESCPAGNAALFLRDQWRQVKSLLQEQNVDRDEGAFSNDEFRNQLIVSFLSLADDPNARHGGRPVVWITRPSNVYFTTGKARRVDINLNSVPSLRVGRRLTAPATWTRSYLTEPPSGIDRERDDFFSDMFGSSCNSVLPLRALFVGVFHTMATGVPYHKSFNIMSHNHAVGLIISGGEPYEVLHDSKHRAIEKMKNLRKDTGFKTTSAGINEMFAGSHLSGDKRTQWVAAMSVFEHNKVRQLWSSAALQQTSTVASSLQIFSEPGSSPTQSQKNLDRLDCCRRRDQHYWFDVTKLVEQGIITMDVLDAILEMRLLRCRLRAINWKSSLEPNESITYGQNLTLQDRQRELPTSRYNDIKNHPERILAFFGLHDRSFEPSTSLNVVFTVDLNSDSDTDRNLLEPMWTMNLS